MLTKTRKITQISALLLAFGLTGLANADEVHLAGSTLGRFNANSFGTSDSLFGLSYSNSTFDNTTVGGSLDLGGNPSPGSNFNNLGSFSLGLDNQNYNGNSFDLMVEFLIPTTIVGGTSAIFSDQIFGTVTNGLGGVFIDFDNTPQVFTYSNANESGSFTFFVNDVSISPGQLASLTGHVTGQQQAVPEVGTTAGIACGVFALFTMLRRRA